MRYSQNNEEDIILKYFGDFKGHLLDIGANDGVTLSNSRKLMEIGWDGDFVEPSDKAFEKLSSLYPNCHKVAISIENGLASLYDSDSHLSGNDTGLLSTLKQEETKRWKYNNFQEIQVEMVDFKTLLEFTSSKMFDFITIDAEGMDYEILSQINLNEVGCKLICVEHNGKDIEKFKSYCQSFGMKEISRNGENLIMGL